MYLTGRLSLTPDRLRLLASLTFNFVAKAPGLVAAFVILPMISRSLGTATYGEFLSALALGSIFTLPFGGVNVVGRRLLASAFGAQDRSRQANVFATTTTLMCIVAIVDVTILIAGTAHAWTRPTFLFISTLPILGALLNVFDNLRASYNEHYVTAIMQLIFQVSIYAAVYFIGLPPGAVALSGLALTLPYALASCATLVILLAQRPFLLSGKIQEIRHYLMPAFGVMMADGALALLLNVSVYWLKVAHDEAMAAWLGTFVRLFQSFMSPVLLILFPVTTYISMRWGGLTAKRRMSLHKIFILAGFAYGIIVGGAMAFVGPLYIDHMFRLTTRGDALDVLALSLFLGTIIAQKTYTMLLYAVSEAKFVSFGTAVVSAIGIAAAALASIWLPAERAVVVLFLAVAVGVPMVLLIGDRRYRLAMTVSML
jgi:hypothetical protein